MTFRYEHRRSEPNTNRIAMNTCNRREFSTLLVAAGAASWARAEGFPERAITIVVPAPAGGTTDLAARALQEPLSKVFGVPVVVDNKGGANGVVGAQAMLAAKPDGHTLLMAVSGFITITPHLVSLPYDPIKDLQPVCNVYSAPQVLVVRASLNDIRTTQDLIKYAKAHPGKLNYASTGNGSGQHITAELFKALTGTFITHIPYRGTGQMVQDMLAQQVDLTMTTAPPLIPHIQSGNLRPLLVTSRARIATLPNVPTAEEVGIKNFEVSTWLALFTHSKAPTPVVNRISEAVHQIMTTPAFRARATELGAEAIYLDPVQLGAFRAIEYGRWGKVIQQSRIKAE